ncbi:hypothetical protein JBE04_23220 [Streptomyces sp. PRKS01-29]|nr:Scr1 family TA system antitoxin-like transcriptional regulator [Streptomyces sabulosicollis]MBI0297298.1 hypothetical protein [Streptomyces sabulosicollis]
MDGLLQTEEHTRALFTMRRPLLSDDVIEQRVAARMARQEIFTKQPAPIFIRAQALTPRESLAFIEELRGEI